MPAPDEPLAEVHDPQGRRVVLLGRIWRDKITVDHAELAEHVDDVLATVAAPDWVEDDPRARRVRYYRRGVGPSRWLRVVVTFEQEPARIVTAFAARRGPRRASP